MNLIKAFALTIGLLMCWLFEPPTCAAPLTTLVVFTGTNGAELGANPISGLVQARDGNLYGTTDAGGPDNNGTVFQFATNGGFTSLYSFTGGNDGASPQGTLVQANDGNLYGTTSGGAIGGNGTVFRITTNGTLTTVFSFTGADDGANPHSGLTLARDGNMYGTALYGGASGNGTVFRIAPNGMFTSLLSREAPFFERG